MSLASSTIMYETDRLLREMVELSTFNKAVAYDRFGQPNVIQPETMMVGFCLGRQAGHTTAIQNFINNQPADRSVLVVTHNHRAAERFKRTIDTTKNYNAISVCRSLHLPLGMRRMHRVQMVPNYIFFDVIDMSVAREWMSNALAYRFIDYDQLRSVVVVS